MRPVEPRTRHSFEHAACRPSTRKKDKKTHHQRRLLAGGAKQFGKSTKRPNRRATHAPMNPRVVAGSRRELSHTPERTNVGLAQCFLPRHPSIGTTLLGPLSSLRARECTRTRRLQHSKARARWSGEPILHVVPWVTDPRSERTAEPDNEPHHGDPEPCARRAAMTGVHSKVTFLASFLSVRRP